MLEHITIHDQKAGGCISMICIKFCYCSFIHPCVIVRSQRPILIEMSASIPKLAFRIIQYQRADETFPIDSHLHQLVKDIWRLKKKIIIDDQNIFATTHQSGFNSLIVTGRHADIVALIVDESSFNTVLRGQFPCQTK
ncbi:hypothetical protein AI20_04925 [Aeromonas hydrophila YL17]|nr:hypothetical protein AI20_04925 [Aeromonas hydrophila YL17]